MAAKRLQDRLEALERQVAQGEQHMEIVEYDGFDGVGKPIRVVEVRFSDMPLVRVAKDLWEAL